ncbi:hypothetical protein TNCV_2504251 [Trichonephila clavipes]|nr:hypothetical protein TNCV_2504251 [Trichonephila clavipes]
MTCHPCSIGKRCDDIAGQCNTLTPKRAFWVVTGSRVFSLTCLLGSLRPELMATLFQPNPRSEEISGSRTGRDFRRMIEDLTIRDINLEMEVKETILVEGTTEIGVRVKILVEAIKGKGDD